MLTNWKIGDAIEVLYEDKWRPVRVTAIQMDIWREERLNEIGSICAAGYGWMSTYHEGARFRVPIETSKVEVCNESLKAEVARLTDAINDLQTVLELTRGSLLRVGRSLKEARDGRS